MSKKCKLLKVKQQIGNANLQPAPPKHLKINRIKENLNMDMEVEMRTVRDYKDSGKDDKN